MERHSLLWHVSFGTINLYHGPGGSPLLFRDRLILFQEQRLMDRSIPTEPGFIVAIEKTTGRELWRQKRDPQPGWGTPIAVQVGDHTEVIISSSRRTSSCCISTGWASGHSQAQPWLTAGGISAPRII